MVATEVRVQGFLCKLMCSGSQPFIGQIDNEEKSSWVTFRVPAKRGGMWDGDVNGFTETDFITDSSSIAADYSGCS